MGGISYHLFLQLEVANCDLRDCKFIPGKPKHKIFWKTFDITFNLLIKSALFPPRTKLPNPYPASLLSAYDINLMNDISSGINCATVDLALAID